MATKFSFPGTKNGTAAVSNAPDAPAPVVESPTIDIEHRRDQLTAKVAELTWDLGGRVDVILKHAAVLQDADAELQEIERILKAENSHTAGACTNCGAPHSSGAAFCWQCGTQIMRQIDTSAIFGQ
jgi:ribosomal protein L40E